MSGGLKKGMTLVELLVVLVILASLAISVAISSGGSLDRAREERTRRQGEAMRNALERADGLSIVSDMGPLLDPSATEAQNLGRLGFLFSRETSCEVSVDEAGGTATTNLLKLAPPFVSMTAPLIPTNMSFANIFELTTKYPSVSLGCGWRGPYCSERVVQDGLLRDGFGGMWECAVAQTNGATTTLLISRGRDRAPDGIAVKDWPDADFTLPVRSPDALSLAVNASCADEALASPFYLHVIAFSPSLSILPTGDDATEMSIATRHFCATNSLSLSIDAGLSAGSRAFFVFAEKGGLYYGAPPQHVVLRPGTNELKVNLVKAE